jgi:hypothetical protein
VAGALAEPAGDRQHLPAVVLIGVERQHLGAHCLVSPAALGGLDQRQPDRAGPAQAEPRRRGESGIEMLAREAASCR